MQDDRNKDRGRFLSREQAFKFQLNQQVHTHKLNTRRPYAVHYFYDNEEGIQNPGAYQVCSYYSMWYCIVQDKETREPRLGEPAPEVHKYNCKDKTKSSQESDNEPETDPINNKIRHSPVAISPRQVTASMLMTATRTAPTTTVAPARAASPVPAAGMTPASFQSKLNATLW
jgi:hypothetical protein